jgi:iron(III) transport system ATP-binding protein
MLSVRDLHASHVDAEGRVVKAVQGISFTVPEAKLFALLGPSGCGKTTTMRAIAGLERPIAGEITVNGEAVYSSSRNIFVAPNRRNFGMVFQSYAIWPHLNVFQNAAFPLQVGKRKFCRAEIEQRVARVLAVVGLEEFAGRPATMLSGGQQQRLALARALAMEPALLLLDEPLSNLDAKLRERMRVEIKRLQAEYGLTTLYVTHDQSEALAMAHEIAVINDGRIVQQGSPRDLYERPESEFVADFVGSTNFVSGIVGDSEGARNVYRAETELGALCVTSATRLNRGESVLISIRPEDIELSDSPATGSNILRATVATKVFLGEVVDFQLQVGSRRLRARSHPTNGGEPGGTVYLRMDPAKCISIKAAA